MRSRREHDTGTMFRPPSSPGQEGPFKRPADTGRQFGRPGDQQDSHISRRPGAILVAVANDSPEGSGCSQLMERGRQIAEDLGAHAPDKVKATLMALGDISRQAAANIRASPAAHAR